MHSPLSQPLQPLPAAAMPAPRGGVIRRAIIVWLRAAFAHWQRRRLISTLRAMDDHVLGSIGIARKNIIGEANAILDFKTD